MKNKTEFFDYIKVAEEKKIPKNILEKLEKEVKEEFPEDLMMFELHMLRAINSEYWKDKAAS